MAAMAAILALPNGLWTRHDAPAVIPSEVARWLCVRRATDEESAVAIVVLRAQKETHSGRIAIRPYTKNEATAKSGKAD